MIEEEINNISPTLAYTEDPQVDISVNISQSGILPQEAHKYMNFTKYVVQNNKDFTSKFNNNLVVSHALLQDIEEEIPEELHDET